MTAPLHSARAISISLTIMLAVLIFVAYAGTLRAQLPQNVIMDRPIRPVRMVVLDFISGGVALSLFEWRGHCWAVTDKGGVQVVETQLCKAD